MLTDRLHATANVAHTCADHNKTTKQANTHSRHELVQISLFIKLIKKQQSAFFCTKGKEDLQERKKNNNTLTIQCRAQLALE